VNVKNGSKQYNVSVYHAPIGGVSTLINATSAYFNDSVITKTQNAVNAPTNIVYWDGGNLFMMN